jgi:hypothetical protein
MGYLQFGSIRPAVFAAALALLPVQGWASLLDQEYAPETFAFLTQFNARRTAQTFTAGHSGRLFAIEVGISQLDSQGNLVVEIHNSLEAGTIQDPMSIIGTTSIPLTSVPSSRPGGTGPEFVPINLSQLNIHVTAGHEYAIVLHRDYPETYLGGNGAVWVGGISNVQGDYLGGQSYFFDPAGDRFTRDGNIITVPDRWIAFSPDSDFAFRTYVVPEPSCLSLGVLIVGIGGIVWRSKHFAG